MTGAAESLGAADPTPEQALWLEHQLCFLVYRLHRGITDLYRPLLAELGLTYPQYLVMLALWQSGKLSVGELGTRLDLASGTLSPLLKRLEGAGLVVRSRSASDERSVVVSLTGAGNGLREKAKSVPSSIADSLAGSAEDYWVARERLTTMLARVDAAKQA